MRSFVERVILVQEKDFILFYDSFRNQAFVDFV